MWWGTPHPPEKERDNGVKTTNESPINHRSNHTNTDLPSGFDGLELRQRNATSPSVHPQMPRHLLRPWKPKKNHNSCHHTFFYSATTQLKIELTGFTCTRDTQNFPGPTPESWKKIDKRYYNNNTSFNFMFSVWVDVCILPLKGMHPP